MWLSVEPQKQTPENQLKTIGTFTEGRLFTVFTRDHSGPAKLALYDDLLCVVEDAGLRRSAQSQLIQMADYCAHAAFQSIQDKPQLDQRFRRQYETTLSRLIARPFGQDEGRCIRGHDYVADTSDCPSERVNPP